MYAEAVAPLLPEILNCEFEIGATLTCTLDVIELKLSPLTIPKQLFGNFIGKLYVCVP